MANACRLTLYLRQIPDEQALYRYLVRRPIKERTALLRNMILAEFHRRQAKESCSRRKPSPPRAPRTRVKTPSAPSATVAQSPWIQRVTL